MNKYQVICGTSEFYFTLQELNSFEIRSMNHQNYILTIKNVNYKVELLEVNLKASKIKLRINNIKKWVEIKTKVHQEIKNLGYDNSKIIYTDEIKSPMPGLVIDVLVKNGQSVQKGDHLITLEAMKMENILRAQHDGEIDVVNVSSTDKVEKNQTLITFKQN